MNNIQQPSQTSNERSKEIGQYTGQHTSGHALLLECYSDQGIVMDEK